MCRPGKRYVHQALWDTFLKKAPSNADGAFVGNHKETSRSRVLVPSAAARRVQAFRPRTNGENKRWRGVNTKQIVLFRPFALCPRAFFSFLLNPVLHPSVLQTIFPAVCRPSVLWTAPRPFFLSSNTELYLWCQSSPAPFLSPLGNFSELGFVYQCLGKFSLRLFFSKYPPVLHPTCFYRASMLGVLFLGLFLIDSNHSRPGEVLCSSHSSLILVKLTKS